MPKENSVRLYAKVILTGEIKIKRLKKNAEGKNVTLTGNLKYQQQEWNREKCVNIVNFMMEMDGRKSPRLSNQNMGSTSE